MQLDKAKIRYPQHDENSDSKKSRVSAYTEDYKGEYYNLSIDKLIPFSQQARRFFDDESISNLAITIKEHGIRQPLTVFPSEERKGFYEIISGERRFRAAKKLNLNTVPCIIVHDKTKIEEIALIENIQRKDLHPVELMKSFQSLLTRKVYKNINELAKKLGLQRTSVNEICNLKSLPQATQNLLIEKNLSSRNMLRKLLQNPAHLHEEIINSYLSQKEISRSKVETSIFKKSSVINIVLENENIKIISNKVSQLSNQQKDQLKVILEELL